MLLLLKKKKKKMLAIFIEKYFHAMIMHFKSLWWGCLPPETAEIAEITKMYKHKRYRDLC